MCVWVSPLIYCQHAFLLHSMPAYMTRQCLITAACYFHTVCRLRFVCLYRRTFIAAPHIQMNLFLLHFPQRCYCFISLSSYGSCDFKAAVRVVDSAVPFYNHESDFATHLFCAGLLRRFLGLGWRGCLDAYAGTVFRAPLAPWSTVFLSPTMVQEASETS